MSTALKKGTKPRRITTRGCSAICKDPAIRSEAKCPAEAG